MSANVKLGGNTIENIDTVKLESADEAGTMVEFELAGGGTYVEANPTLSGNEADLKGILIGDTKYKVIGTHKYQHYVKLRKPSSYLTTLPPVNAEMYIINDSSTAFTWQTFFNRYSSFTIPCDLATGSTVFANGTPISFSIGKFQQTWTVKVNYQQFSDGACATAMEQTTNDGTISNFFVNDEVTQLS